MKEKKNKNLCVKRVMQHSLYNFFQINFQYMIELNSEKLHLISTQVDHFLKLTEDWIKVNIILSRPQTYSNAILNMFMEG